MYELVVNIQSVGYKYCGKFLFDLIFGNIYNSFEIYFLKTFYRSGRFDSHQISRVIFTNL